MNNRTIPEGVTKEPDLVQDKLPLIITDIKIQKKNKNRYSLFNEDLFLAGISEKTLADFSLKKGVELTPFLFKQILQSEEIETAKSICLRYLGRRDHTSHEIRQKLSKKGVKDLVIDQLIGELHQKQYLNDAEFALKYSMEKANIYLWGPKKIEAALYQKGINQVTIQKTIKKVTYHLPQKQICVDLALKRKKHFLREIDPEKRKQKIYRFLSARGFRDSDILDSLPIITAELDV